MFIQLSQMLVQANLSGLHLMVRPTGEGKIQIAMSSESTHWQAENPKLKAALAQTLVIETSAIDMQDEFTHALTELSDTYVQARTVSNASTVKATIENASATVSNSTEETENVTISDSENDLDTTKEVEIGQAVDDGDLF
jgi:hypothetical protein